MKCKNCKHLQTHEEWCELVLDSPDTEIERECCHFKQKTNADRIRAMSDEELAVWLVKQTAYAESAWSETTYLNYATGRSDTKANAMADTLKWLQQPAEEAE